MGWLDRFNPEHPNYSVGDTGGFTGPVDPVSRAVDNVRNMFYEEPKYAWELGDYYINGHAPDYIKSDGGIGGHGHAAETPIDPPGDEDPKRLFQIFRKDLETGHQPGLAYTNPSLGYQTDPGYQKVYDQWLSEGSPVHKTGFEHDMNVARQVSRAKARADEARRRGDAEFADYLEGLAEVMVGHAEQGRPEPWSHYWPSAVEEFGEHHPELIANPNPRPRQAGVITAREQFMLRQALQGKPADLAPPAVDWDPVMKSIADTGGYTFGEEFGDAPTSGYMISLPGTEERRPTDTVTPATEDDYHKRHWDQLRDDPDLSQGGWDNKDTFYTDLSRNDTDLYRTVGDAVTTDQLGIYDLNQEQTLDTYDNPEDDRDDYNPLLVSPGPIASRSASVEGQPGLSPQERRDSWRNLEALMRDDIDTYGLDRAPGHVFAAREMTPQELKDFKNQGWKGEPCQNPEHSGIIGGRCTECGKRAFEAAMREFEAGPLQPGTEDHNAYERAQVPVVMARVAMPTYYHLTDNPDFQLDPERLPENFYDEEEYPDAEPIPGLFAAPESQLHMWRRDYNWDRPYTAEIFVPEDADSQVQKSLDDLDVGAGLDPEEVFIPADIFDQVEVKGTRPTSEFNPDSTFNWQKRKSSSLREFTALEEHLKFRRHHNRPKTPKQIEKAREKQNPKKESLDPNMLDDRIDIEKLVKNALSRYRGATPEQVEAGRNWYGVARARAEELARRTGGDFSKAAAIIAAMSPQMEWEGNLNAAAHFINTYDPTRKHEWRRPNVSKQGLQAWNDLTGGKTPQTPEDFATLAKLSGQEDPDWAKEMAMPGSWDRAAAAPSSKAWTGTGLPTLGDNVLRAMNVYDSDDPRELLDYARGGPKIHSFWRNFLGDESFATIDKHMLRALDRGFGEDPLLSYGSGKPEVTRKMTPEDKRVNELEGMLGYTRSLKGDEQQSVPTGYNTYSEAIRRATAEANKERGPQDQLTAAQMQAIIWVQHKADMDAFRDRKSQEAWDQKNPGKPKPAPKPYTPAVPTNGPAPDYYQSDEWADQNPYAGGTPRPRVPDFKGPLMDPDNIPDPQLGPQEMSLMDPAPWADPAWSKQQQMPKAAGRWSRRRELLRR